MTALLYLLAVLIWGTTFYAITFQIGEVPTIQSVFYRYLIAAILLWLIVSVRGGLPRFSRDIHLRFAALGLLLFSFNYVMVYYATAYIASGLVSVVFSMMIVVNTLQLWALYGERPQPRLLFAALLGIGGLTLLFLRDIMAASAGTQLLTGLLFALAATVSAASGNLVSQRLSARKVTVLQANTWGMTYAALFLFLTATIMPEPWRFDTSMAYVSSLLYLAVFGSVVAFFAYLTIVGRIGATRASYIAIFYSMVALMISTALEGLEWNATMGVGVALILIGNVFIIPKASDKKTRD